MHKANIGKSIKMKKPANKLAFFGLALLILAIALFILSFYSVIYSEVTFFLDKDSTVTEDTKIVIVDNNIVDDDEQSLEDTNEDIVLDIREDIGVTTVKDTEFALVIPTIGANAKVVKDVDPFNEDIYASALNRGIAHSKWTAYPGNLGNTFLFAHSSIDFYEANKHNVKFYRLKELVSGDPIYVVYNKKIYKYSVTSNEVVNRDQVEFLVDQRDDTNTLTLMTCWPAGTNWKRVLVKAELVVDQSE